MEKAALKETSILVRYGEIALKGRNRHLFEQQLQNNVKGTLSGIEGARVERLPGRLLVSGPESGREQILERLQRVPGIVSLSVIYRCELDLDRIKKKAVSLVKALSGGKEATFKIEARRSNKQFPYDSPALNSELGAHLLEKLPRLKVDLHNPDLTLSLEIGYSEAFLYSERVAGPGGLPVGVSGKALLLLSGGIDSPVAGWLAMKRGLKIEALHFHSFPFTGKRSLQKAEDLCRQLALHGGKIRLHTVSVTAIQKEIRVHCPESLAITLLRRMMMRIAEALCAERGLEALVTGENLGQVASQTLFSLQVIAGATKMLILRPLITEDKHDIIALAEKIGTYDISIRPYEDCCTLFVPRNPATRPSFKAVLRAETALETERLVKEAMQTLKGEAYLSG